MSTPLQDLLRIDEYRLPITRQEFLSWLKKILSGFGENPNDRLTLNVSTTTHYLMLRYGSGAEHFRSNYQLDYQGLNFTWDPVKFSPEEVLQMNYPKEVTLSPKAFYQLISKRPGCVKLGRRLGIDLPYELLREQIQGTKDRLVRDYPTGKLSETEVRSLSYEVNHILLDRLSMGSEMIMPNPMFDSKPKDIRKKGKKYLKLSLQELEPYIKPEDNRDQRAYTQQEIAQAVEEFVLDPHLYQQQFPTENDTPRSRLIKLVDFLFLKSIMADERIADALTKLKSIESDPDETPDVVKGMLKAGFSSSFIDQTIIYPSGRPRTTLPFIKQIPLLENREDYLVLHGSQGGVLIEPEYWDVTIKIKDPLLIPVVRYQAGMSRGLYYSGKGAYCGTFYYFEPNSSYYLTCTSALITPNKITALAYLLEELEPDLYQQLFKEDIEKVVELMVAENAKISRSEATEILTNMANFNYNFTHYNKDLYSVEDPLDQPICELAMKAKYQVIILTTMTGGSRMVTEVVDSRSRQESFDSIVRLAER